MNDQKEINKLIDIYLNQPKVLYEHLFSSYHQFVEEIIPYSLIQEQNYFFESTHDKIIYLHGFKCSNVRIKPATFENDNEIKFPTDARKNHLNYFATVVADVQQFVEKFDSITGEKTIKYISDMEKETHVANIPIMVKSKYCSTHIKQNLKGECKFDPGGYFIVNGAEKIIMSMEKIVDNKILVFTKKDASYESGLIHTAQINSRRNDWSDNLQILTIKNRKDGVLTVSSSSQLVDIPLFILMRALGIVDDQRIISFITYDLEDIKMLNILRASIANSVDDDGNPINSKEEAFEYLISKLKRNRRISQSNEEVAKIQKKIYLEKIFHQDLLPHLGEDITKKIVFLGLMANKLLNVMLGRQDVDDRDALQNKRIEPPGILLGQLFRQNWKKMLNQIGTHFKNKKRNDVDADETPINVINQIKPSIIEQGLKTALATGVWGMNKTKKGVAQSLQRLSWVQGISYLRRILAPSMDESTAKVTSIRHVNNNQAQLLCITADSEVLLSNKMDIKKIIDIVDGDNVITVNRETLSEQPSYIYNKFCHMSDELLEIKTISGRTIKVTPDHPFLIYENNKYIMKNAGELELSDKLVIRHMEKMIIPEFNTNVIIKDSDVTNYNIQLLETGYLNTFINQDRLIIIARLLGIINTNGYINIKNGNYTATFLVDEEIDTYTLYDDISKLGFGSPNIKRKINKKINNSNKNQISYATWEINKSGPFAYLLTLLGGIIGCKMDTIKKVPEWIISANKLIKREFLSAFQGGCGNKISYQFNDENFKALLPETLQICVPQYENEIISYMKQIATLFNEFNIYCSVESKKTFETKKVIELIFENTTENIINYADLIGYRYSESKRKASAAIIEYLKIKQELFHENLDRCKLGKELPIIYDLSNKQIDKIKTKINAGNKVSETIFSCPKELYKNNRNEVLSSLGPILYDDFIKDNILHTGNILVNIKSIKKVQNEMVYDFTTYSDNHSFIANSFVVSNCPVETPEGAKIGIVKSLATSSTITVQNSSQIDVLKSLLNNSNIKHPYDIDPLTMNNWVKIMINGDWYGVCKIKHAQDIYDNLKKSRRYNLIDKFTSIVFDYSDKEIRCYYDGGRLIRPLLIVNNNKHNITSEVIKDLNLEISLRDKTKSWKKILSKYPNLIEYEDIESLNHLLIAENEYRLKEAIEASQRKIEYNDATKINRYGDYRFVKYTHCDLHAWLMMGSVVSNVPFSNHNYATRNIIHFSQAKQSIGTYLSSYKDRMDISQILYHPQIPLVTTQAMKYNGCLDLPYGENAIVAIASYTGLTNSNKI